LQQPMIFKKERGGKGKKERERDHPLTFIKEQKRSCGGKKKRRLSHFSRSRIEDVKRESFREKEFSRKKQREKTLGGETQKTGKKHGNVEKGKGQFCSEFSQGNFKQKNNPFKNEGMTRMTWAVHGPARSTVETKSLNKGDNT